VSGYFTGLVWIAFWPVSIVTLLCGRYLGTLVVKWLDRPMGGHHHVVVVGTDPRAEQLCQTLSLRRESRLIGFVRSPGSRPVSSDVEPRILGGLADLESILVKQPVDEVVIALPFKSDHEEIQRAIEICERVGVEAKYFFDGFQVSVAKQRLIQDEYASFVAVKLVEDDFRVLIKRCIDVAGSAFGLVVFSPLLLLIAAAIKLTSPGPVLFTQERYGLNKRSFRMYKFRSMVADAERLQEKLESQNEAGGPVFKIQMDPRVTSIGRLLRRTSLDELPQLLNVLMGDMSLVGPRPLPLRDVARFNAGWLMRRFSVKPGITCLWQIHGRSNTTFDKWIELDLQYIDNWSLGLDMKILVQTVPAVIFGIGAV
jgi:exopolysaccharide biosynthesis polyprenyl glycosylphosphotransferase